MTWGEIAGWVVVLLSLGGVSMILRRSLTSLQTTIESRLDGMEKSRRQDQATFLRLYEEDDLRGRVGLLRGEVAALTSMLNEKKATEESLFVGSFLPDDQGAAEFERQIKRSEDHAIAAAGPVRFSSTPSRGSGSRSAREPSTQRPRGSGRP